jgi:hypothetical protein
MNLGTSTSQNNIINELNLVNVTCHKPHYIWIGMYISNIILHAPTQCKHHTCQVELVMSNMIETGNQFSHVKQ